MSGGDAVAGRRARPRERTRDVAELWRLVRSLPADAGVGAAPAVTDGGAELPGAEAADGAQHDAGTPDGSRHKGGAGDGDRHDAWAAEGAPHDADHLRAVIGQLEALQGALDAASRGRRTRATAAGNGTAPHAGTWSAQPDVTLAAAGACYIARDLAARRLSAFTSAEGHRLARALAAIGGVEAIVEPLLADANTVRLHPGPLAEAVSHSAG